jgi:PAS domain S-box-containing protein
MPYQITFPTLILIATSCAGFVLAWTAWQRRNVPGTTPFALMMVSAAFWTAASALEYAATDLPTQIIWAKIQYLGILSLPVLWLLFSLEFSQVEKRLPSWLLGLLWVLPVISLIMVWTNEAHGLIWSRIVPMGSINRLIYTHGAWFWILVVYSYLLLMLGSLALIYALARFPSLYRQHAVALLLGIAVPWLANILYLLAPMALNGIDPTPVAFVVTGLIYGLGIYRFQLLNLTPVAQDELVEALTDGIIVLDRQRRVTMINPAAQAILGVGEVTGQTAFQAFSSLPDLLQQMQAPEPASSAVELRLAGPPVRIVELYVVPLAGKNSRGGRLAVLHDVTLIRLSEERFRTMLQATPDGMLAVNENGRIIMVNNQVLEILGYSQDELLDQSVELLVPGKVGRHDSLNAESIRSANIQSMGSQMPRFALRKDGSEFPVEISLSPFETPEGPAALVTLRDISQRRQAEEQLLMQSVALESAANAIVITDVNGRISWVNPAFTYITGYTPAEVIGQSTTLLASGQQNGNFYSELWDTILSGKVWHGELTNKRKDGSLYVEEQTIAPVRSPEGEITHFIAVQQDITERRQVEQMRDDLMSVIVHDLRNPLASILTSLDLFPNLLKGYQQSPEAEEMLEITRANARRMLGMVNAILDMRKLESGNMPLRREGVILAELVEQACRYQAPLAGRYEVLLLNDVPFELPKVFVDPLLIFRVFQNLVDNAIKYTPPGGNVEINARLDISSRQIELAIKDGGPGIDPEVRQHLFQKFVSDPKARRGFGLGLVFCRMAVEAHGGQIWAESEPGQGTTFRFTLPIEATQAAEIQVEIPVKETLSVGQ